MQLYGRIIRALWWDYTDFMGGSYRLYGGIILTLWEDHISKLPRTCLCAGAHARTSTHAHVHVENKEVFMR